MDLPPTPPPERARRRLLWPVIDVLMVLFVGVGIVSWFFDGWNLLQVGMIGWIALMGWLGHDLAVTQFDREFPGWIRAQRRERDRGRNR